MHLYWGFKKRYELKRILFGNAADGSLMVHINTVFGYIAKKMCYADAMIAACVEYHADQIEGFVSWNAVHFEGRLPVDVYTPSTWLKDLR